MARKRVHEIASEQGLPTSVLLARLREAGVDAKVALSTVDEEVVERVLENGDTTGDGHARVASPSSKRTTDGAASAPRDTDRPPRNGSRGAPGRRRPPAKKLGWLERARLARRVRRVRKQHESQLLDLGGLIFDMYRFGSTRQDLVREKLKLLFTGTGELRELEAQLGEELRLRERKAEPGSGFRWMSLPAAIITILVLAAAWLLGGIRTQREHDTPAVQRFTNAQLQAAFARQYRSVAASVHGRRIAVYRSSRSTHAVKTLRNPNPDGAPLVLLVKSVHDQWLQVYLPTRPNGSVGWIKSSEVTLVGNNYRVKIQLNSHRLTAYKGKSVMLNTPIGVGRAVTPTPSGLYYITELLKQPDSTGLYGPWAFGLSAHSNVLHEFAGADGILGIHGTDFPQGLGTNVSHGCIRVNNRAITRLANVLPAGTPVEIVRT
jgi:lipoprotein-anchoring transpeptidase ErfK/SrfK